MRRNDVVLVGKPDLYRFYGRIVSVGELIEVVDCGRNRRFMPADELEPTDYKGRDEYDWKGGGGRFLRMPTLRKLKQMAARYDKTVWKRNR